MRFCPNCGIPVGESPRYCAGCGTHVTPAQPVSSPAQPVPSWAGPAPAERGPFDSAPLRLGAAERGPFDSAPLRLGAADAQPAGRVSVAESPPGEQAVAAPAAAGVPESWLPAELTAAGPSQTTGFEVRDPWTHHEVADPWTAAGLAGSLAGTGATSVTSPPTWLDTVSPIGHPQADGMRGAAPATASRRAAPGSRRRPMWSGHRMTITAMVVTVALVSTAGIAAWQVSQLHAQPGAVTTGVHRANHRLVARTGHPGSTQPAAHGRSAPLPRASRSAAPSVAHRAATGGPVGNAVVAVGPQAARGPQVRQVVALLTTYFESINDQNFAQYQSLFIPSIQRMMTHFGTGYTGTFDSGATLTQLVTTGPRGLAATVAFISHQNPANSPDGVSCDSWLITLFLKRQGTALHIRHPRPGFPQSVLACH
jgi:hypothetical protein